MKIDLGEVSEKALNAVIEVGDFVKDSQSKIQSIKFKDIKNPQTNVDIEAEEMLKQRLRIILPGSGFLLEEGQDEKCDEYTWVIDPIDGTKYFSTNFPMYFTQISLLYKKTNIFSAIYNPNSKQMFHAVIGRGSFLNGNKLQLNYDGPLKKSLISIELGQYDETGLSIDFLKILGSATNKLYMMAGLLAPYLLTNTVQAYIRYYNGENFVYDLEPRWLVIREAGGVVHEFDYKGRKLYIAAHPRLVTEIESVLGISTS